MSSPQSSNAAMATDQQRQDSEQLKQFGYGQELHRTMSMFSNFAVTFSYISVTTGIFALFAVGLGTGGPAFIWSWPIVFFGQLLVGLVFRPKRQFLNLGPDSIAVLGLYLVGIVGLVTLT